MLKKLKHSKLLKVVIAISILTLSVVPSSQVIMGSEPVGSKDMLLTEPLIITKSIPINLIDNTITEDVLVEIEKQKIIADEIAEQIKEEQRLTKIRTQRRYINSIVCDPKHIDIVTGLKEEDYKILTKGTWWEGHEDTLIMLERDYSINAMFAMSVSTLESGYGKSNRSKTEKNFYGIELPRVWNSLYDNSVTFGYIIKNYYVDCDRHSVTKISTKYCPPNHNNWAEFVSDNMKNLHSELVSRMNDTNK